MSKPIPTVKLSDLRRLISKAKSRKELEVNLQKFLGEKGL